MATRSDADCNVGYYGVGLDELLGEAGSIAHPTMLHVAEADEYCPKETQQKLGATFANSPLVTVYSYPGMPHAFARVDGIHYDAEEANLANGRTYEFLKQNLA